MADGAILARRAGGEAEGAADSSTAAAADRIVFLGHATVLIEVDGVRLLTDPLLRDRVAHLRRQVPPLQPAVYARLDAALISHLHHDHLDLASLRLLGLDTPLLVPAGAGELLRGKGFTRVRELSVGETANVGALQVDAVEARHDGRRHPGGMRAETLGYVIRGRRTVYFAGDTELFDGMSALAPPDDVDEASGTSLRHDFEGTSPRPDVDDMSGRAPRLDVDDMSGRAPRLDVDDMSSRAPRLDVALLPVAGWGPKLGPGHMDPLDAARAAGLIQPRVAIPMHWGTLLPIGVARSYRDRFGDPPHRFAEHVASLAPSVEVRILEPGHETTL
jgi:L-ascorbate metabolism protein UlaG (beta-lactamase superfamily)